MLSERPAARSMTSGSRTRDGFEARVSALHCYPVKGCAPITVTESVLTPSGLAHDRSFMVTDGRGRYRTQRHTPQLALIRPAISADGARLTLRTPQTGSLDITVDTTGERRDVELFGATYRGIDQGDEVAAWLSDTLEKTSRLVRVPPEHDRVTDGQVAGTSGYADSCPIHLLSEESLHRLNRELRDGGSPALPMSRFRPNIVIAGGTGEAHVEDTARRIRIGAAELSYAKVAIRCVVTTVDQLRGERSGPEPLATLARFRRVEGGIAFGAKFAVTAAGTISVGDAVRFTARGASEM